MPNKIDSFFRLALESGASDIYLSTGLPPVVRVHGDLKTLSEHPAFAKKDLEEIILEILTPRQRERFETTSDLDFAYTAEGVASFRVNLFIQRNGISLACRLIPESVPPLDSLDLPEALKRVVNFPNGLVLITGPTGSGKSTTLAAILDAINANFKKHIVTVEDPIEFIHKNKMSVVEQREVGTHTANFKSALRAALREDVNVILVGEMRDLETISLALTAAETGHLVLATLHTRGAAEAISRIIDVFPGEQQNQVRSQLAGTLRAIFWQALFKKKGGEGRIPALEILFNTTAVSNMIRKNVIHQIPSAMETGGADGMQTMGKTVTRMLESGLIERTAMIDEYLK